jgi:hypothetical protein
LFSLHAVRLMFYAIRPAWVSCHCRLPGALPETFQKCIKSNTIAI